MRCLLTVENLGFSIGRPSELSAIQRCMEDFFQSQLDIPRPLRLFCQALQNHLFIAADRMA